MVFKKSRNKFRLLKINCSLWGRCTQEASQSNTMFAANPAADARPPPTRNAMALIANFDMSTMANKSAVLFVLNGCRTLPVS